MSTSPHTRTEAEKNNTAYSTTDRDNITEDELIAAIANRREEPIEKVAEEIKPILNQFDVDQIISQKTDDIWF